MTHPTIEATARAMCFPNRERHMHHCDPEALANSHTQDVPGGDLRRETNWENRRSMAEAAARVILSAPVSDAEVKAALVANYGKAWAKFAAGIQDAARKTMRAAITAALAQRLKQLEGCV